MDNNDTPFAKITFDNARVIYDSSSGDKSEIRLICRYIDGSYFEKDASSELFFEYPLLGSLVKFNVHNHS